MEALTYFRGRHRAENSLSSAPFAGGLRMHIACPLFQLALSAPGVRTWYEQARPRAV